MVAGNLCFESTRAASITAAVPEPSSLAPGENAVAFIGSVTRLSMWPVMMTTSFGRSVPRWIATALQTLVGVGMRRQGVAGAEADEFLDRPLHLAAADRCDDLHEHAVGRRRLPGTCGGA